MKAPPLKLLVALLMCAAALLAAACTNDRDTIPFNLEMEARQYRAPVVEQPLNDYKILIEAYARCHGRHSKEEQEKRAANAARRIREYPGNATVIRHQIRAECFSTPMPGPTTTVQENVPDPTEPNTPATGR